MLRATLTTIALAATLALPSGALAKTQTAAGGSATASAGGVTATFSYKGRFPSFHSERLKIARAGRVAYNRPVTSRFCGHDCVPVGASGLGPTGHAVQMARLNGAWDVLVNLYTGGAHCCSVAQVFTYAPRTGTYVKAERNFGDPGYRLTRLGGRLVFMSADDAFAYEFTDYAGSGLPIQIVSFSRGRFDDVTRSYPKLIAADAARWLRAFRATARHGYADSVGVVAAWAADQYLLGKRASADRQLNAWAVAGRLKSTLAPQEPGGARFIAKLKRFLRQEGYTR